MRVRAARLKEIVKLLLREDFIFEPASATPIASECLEDGTGFLTPKDTDEFDLAVDEYINGKFVILHNEFDVLVIFIWLQTTGEMYTCPASGKEIVSALVKLRDSRESQIYLEVLTAMTQAITMCLEDPLYGSAVLGNAKRK